MDESNLKISGFQLSVISFFISTALFVGLGIAGMFALNARDAWVSTLLSFIVGLIPIGFILYLSNYKPEKNIFEKNKALFGKIIGSIVNIVLCLYALFMVVISIWATTTFAITMYLVKTPANFIAGIFILAAIYAVTKGIESIGRTSEILFFMTVLIVTIIVWSLISMADYDHLKPVLAEGIMPALKNSFIFCSFCFTPSILLLAIPKTSVSNPKNYYKYLLVGFGLGIVLMFAVFFLIPVIMTPGLAAIYRFPAYYVQRKISIGGAINNLENFLSIHWFFSTFILIVMGLYFLNVYLKGVFKYKKNITGSIIVTIIGIAVVILQNHIFKNSVTALNFMKNNFPIYISLTLLSIIILSCVIIAIRKNKKKAA